jgi:GT2 family glycosyltransferase
VEYDRSQAEGGGSDDSASLILIRTGANLGFAGGNNVGLRYALARGDFAYVWLLNNDTIIKPDALSQMVQRMEEKPDAGMCGSLIPFYNKPEIIWAAGGGTLSNWLIKSANICYSKPVAEVSSREEIESRMDYLVGASMLVSVDFLRLAGLLNEDYFLYFEEPDWYMRGKRRFSLAYADKAVVYHKVGISTSRWDATTSTTTLKFSLASQLRFTAKFFPFALPLVLFSALPPALFRIAKYHLKLIFSHNR